VKFSNSKFQDRNFAKFYQILNPQNDFAEIRQDSAKRYFYFAKFCRIITFANEILQNFVKYLVLRKKFRKILSNTYFTKWFCRNFSKYFSYFAKFHRMISLAKRNFEKFSKFCFTKFWNFFSKISRNYEMKLLQYFVSRNFRDHPSHRTENPNDGISMTAILASMTMPSYGRFELIHIYS